MTDKWTRFPSGTPAGDLLLGAAALLRDLAADLSGDARFRALLSANAVATAEREIRAGDRAAVLAAKLPADAAAIRSGAFDDSDPLFGPLYKLVVLQAWIADPSVPHAGEMSLIDIEASLP